MKGYTETSNLIIFLVYTRNFWILFFACILYFALNFWRIRILIVAMHQQGATYSNYTEEFKEKVVLEYKKNERGRGYEALAGRFKIDGGPNLVKAWVKAYDGTRSSLAKHHDGGVPSMLDQDQKDELVKQFVEERGDKGLYTGRADISKHIQENTGLDLAPSTISKYSSGYNIGLHRTKKSAPLKGRSRFKKS